LILVIYELTTIQKHATSQPPQAHQQRHYAQNWGGRPEARSPQGLAGLTEQQRVAQSFPAQ